MYKQNARSSLNLCLFNLYKSNTCLFRTYKLVPRRFDLDRLQEQTRKTHTHSERDTGSLNTNRNNTCTHSKSADILLYNLLLLLVSIYYVYIILSNLIWYLLIVLYRLMQPIDIKRGFWVLLSSVLGVFDSTLCDTVDINVRFALKRTLCCIFIVLAC